jgi:hypothetical protein
MSIRKARSCKVSLRSKIFRNLVVDQKAVPSCRQHGDGLEELEPTDRNDSTLTPRWRLGLATIVPFDAS